MITYKYTKVDKLKEPHHYIYTHYLGVEFIHSYLNDRLSIIKRIKAKRCEQSIREVDVYLCVASKLKLEKGKELPLTRLHNKIERLTSFNVENEIITEELLTSLLFVQLSIKETRLVKEWLDRLVQRFEVSKKISEVYLSGFHAGKGKKHEIRLYWLFSLLLALYYSKEKNIKYLSVLLKVNDLLFSLDVDITSEIPKEGLELVLLIETESIKLLIKNIKEGVFCI